MADTKTNNVDRNEEALKKLYKSFTPGKSFEETNISGLINNWKGFRCTKDTDLDKSFDQWVNKTDNQRDKDLPGFLLYNTQILQTGLKETEKILMIKKVDNNNYSINLPENKKNEDKPIEEKAKAYYNEIIFKIIKTISSAQNMENLYETEQIGKKDENDLSGRNFFRFMAIYETLSREKDDSIYNSLFWGVQPKSVERLETAFGIGCDETKSFLERNHEVYKKAKEVLIGEKVVGMEMSEIYRLNKFLWDLQADSENINTDSFIFNNVIFHGAPGTGKTFTVGRDIEKFKLCRPKDFGDSKFIQFHPSYTYQDFIEGIKPMGIDPNGNLKLQVLNGSFKEFCIKVRRENEKMFLDKNANPDPDVPNTLNGWPHYFFVVDEINRGNLSNIFGETFTLLEYRDYDFSGNYTKTNSSLSETALAEVIKRQKEQAENTLIEAIETKMCNCSVKKIKDALDKYKNDKTDENKSELLNAVNSDDTFCAKVKKEFDEYNECKNLIYKQVGDKVCFGIPFNIHFIGMMNDIDRSIDSFDLALRRRFSWKPLNCDYSVVREQLNRVKKINKEDVNDYVLNCKLLNYYVCGDTNYKTYFDSIDLGIRYQIGHAFFLKIKSKLENKNASGGVKDIKPEDKEAIFDNFIHGTLREYFSDCSDSEKEIDDKLKTAKIIFTRKWCDYKELERKLNEQIKYVVSISDEEQLKSLVSSFKKRCAELNKWLYKKNRDKDDISVGEFTGLINDENVAKIDDKCLEIKFKKGNDSIFDELIIKYFKNDKMKINKEGEEYKSQREAFLYGSKKAEEK